MNDNSRSLADEEKDQVRKLVAKINAILQEEVYSDAVVIAALADKLATATMANVAGQVVYYGEDAQRSIVANVKEALRIVTYMLQGASEMLPDMISHLEAHKNREDVVH